MTTDQMFDHAINAQKAKAFDFMATALGKLQVENNRLQKAVDLWLTECDWCSGTGERSRFVRQSGNEELIKETCCNCEGTGKIPK